MAFPLKSAQAMSCGQTHSVFVRGTTAEPNSDVALVFRQKVRSELDIRKVQNSWSELNYPATAINPIYGESVATGTRELIDYLNARAIQCPREAFILGGYSQGADVIGWALEWQGYGGLSAASRNQIGYAALYGDPKFNAGPVWQRQAGWRPWWVRGDAQGFRPREFPFNDIVPNSGMLGARSPYAPAEFEERFGSWCDKEDKLCTGTMGFGTDMGSHGSVYRDSWIANSAQEIASRAISKRNSLNPNLTQIPVPGFTITNGNTGTPPPPPPTIHTLLRTKDAGGTNQVYAATKYAVTEGWWRPGGDGVHTKELIHIAQGNIMGIDKTNLPEGKQAVYTAVPDGIWETWWDATHGPTSAKIITGLSGVRQVIADNRWENGQYVHRLYILAQDGPYEAWWKDGDPTGIHLRRLVQIDGGVTMVKSTGPSGEDQLYVATPTWVYEIWWNSGGIHWSTMINITQGNIDSLSKVTLPGGQQRLFTGTSTGVWQSIWQNSTPVHNLEVTGKSGLVHTETTLSGDALQTNIATPSSIQEFWRTPTNAGNDTLTTRPGDITVFDKYIDGGFQQVYFGTTNGGVYEVYWGGGAGPRTKLLFGLAA